LRVAILPPHPRHGNLKPHQKGKLGRPLQKKKKKQESAKKGGDTKVGSPSQEESEMRGKTGGGEIKREAEEKGPRPPQPVCRLFCMGVPRRTGTKKARIRIYNVEKDHTIRAQKDPQKESGFIS